MRIFLKIVLGIVVLLLVIVAGAYLWASSASSRILATTYDVHSVDFPIPFPLAAEEVAALGLTEEAAQKVALERAIARGKHLVSARYPCTACHGENFGGTTLIDDAMLGTHRPPNITAGRGSRTINFQPRDWDRIVRHGVFADGRPAIMPSEDFVEMSDQELSDIISYIRSMPPVDNVMAPSTHGPLGKFLIATGEMPLAAARMTHKTTHAVMPPAAEANAEFGKHLATVCVGCHRSDYSGGPIVGGDPAWPPARNITPAPGALGGWTYEQFVAAVRDGKRPDGTDLRLPMTFVLPYLKNASDTELRALWAYLQTVPPVPVTPQ
jgi:mono/diheme cytochrome c family protein